MYDSYEANKYKLEEDFLEELNGEETAKTQWEMEKAQLKELLNRVQKLSFQIGAPILLSVHPDGNKCAALYNQVEQATEVEDGCCFLRIRHKKEDEKKTA
ncbi:MAG: hypothetical protein N2645_10585 [Clostridia bacterium]|nr:hypothetical protein [Clostridia bacterium]